MKTSNKILSTTFFLIFLTTVITLTYIRMGTSEIEPTESIGEETTENYNFKYLRAIDIAVGQVTLIQQNGPSHIELKCADNIREHLVIEFEDNEHYIGVDQSKNGKLDIEIIVYVENIESITISDNAKLVSNGTFKTNEINLTTQGNGSIQMPIEANLINTFTRDNSNIRLDGIAKNLNAVVNNNGKVDALDLVTDAVVANVGDTGRMNITVNNSLTVNLSNAGELSYKGDPVNLQKNGVIDAAQLIKL